MGSGYRISAKGKDAEVFIYEDVGDSFFGGVTAKQFTDDLKKLGPVDTLNVRINSYGGDVFDGLAIYRQLADHKAKKIVHIDGIAASIASVIAMAGSEIHMAEAGSMMIHDPWGMAMGNAKDFRDMADRLDMTAGSLADVYAARTGNKREQIAAWMNDETWFTAEEAMKNGFATHMAENVKMAARLDPSKHKFRNIPDRLKAQPHAAVPSAIDPKQRPNFDRAASAQERMSAKILLRNSRSG